MCSVALDVDRVDDTLDVLRHRHRRAVLADLDGRSPSVSLGDLAERVAHSTPRPALSAAPASGPAPTDSLSPVDRVEIDLHHCHLPMLDDVGLLTYRPSAGTVVDWHDLDLPEGWPADPSLEPLLAVMRSE